MSRPRLLRGVAAGALTATFLSCSALAQEALPEIDIGTARLVTGPGGAGAANSPGIGGAAAEDPTTYNPPNATTALKIDTPIMDTPASIQVVPQQVLQDQQALTVARAVDNVSGVRSYAGTETYQVRGFFTYNTYTDGLLLGPGVSANASMVNVDRVEVLKGPASILYGRADPGGIVNLVTKQPQATQHTAVSQLFGSWDTYRTTFDTTGPLTKDDTLLYRVTAEIDHARSFQEFDFTRNYFVSPVIKWNIDAATQVTLNLRYTHQVTPVDNGTIAYTKYNPMSLVFGVGPVSFLPRGRNFGEPDSNQRIDNLSFGSNISHKFNDDWILTNRFEASLNKYLGREMTASSFDPTVPTQLDRQSYLVAVNDYVFTTNLDLSGKFETFGVKHTVLLGGDFFSRYNHGDISFPWFPSSNIDYLFPIHSFNPTDLALFDRSGLLGLAVHGRNRYDWYGAYVQDNIALPYNFFVLAGARYDHAIYHDGGSFIYAGNALSGDGLDHTIDNSQRVTPRFGLLWRPIPEVSVYGSYLENFGQNAGTSGPSRAPLPPETAQGWEVGVKTELFDKRFTASLDYFYLMKQHVAAPDPDPARAALGYQVSLGETRNNGIEFDAAGEILPGWKAIVSYAYIDSLITKDAAYNVYDPLGNLLSVNGYQGFTQPGVSRHMGSLWTTYEFQNGDWKGLKFGGGANMRSKSYADLYNSFHVPSYATVGLMVAYSWTLNGNKLTAQLNVDNLLDTRYYTEASAGPLGVAVGAPRTFKGSIGMEF